MSSSPRSKDGQVPPAAGSIQDRRNHNLNVALDLAAAGIPVLIAADGSKLDKKGKPIRAPLVDWGHEATTDPKVIKEWFLKYPKGVPGIVTGKRSGLAVADCDVKNGKDGIAAIRRRGIDPDKHAVVIRTPSGGRHLYYRHRDGLGCPKDFEAEGVDIRGEGGFIFAPGAINALGQYVVEEGNLLDEYSLGLPEWPRSIAPTARPKPQAAKPSGNVDRSELESALLACPANLPYGDWVDLLMGLHHEAGGEDWGLALAHYWSARDERYSSKQVETKWRSFGKGHKDEEIAAGTIFREAKKHGWTRPPITADRFEDVEPDVDDDLLGPAPGALQFLTSEDCSTRVARDYVVKGLIAPGQVGCLFGEPGSGKSVLGPSLTYSVARGEDVFGLSVRAGDAWYVACEDEEGMAQRISALHAEHGPASRFRLVRGCSDLFSAGTVKGHGSPHFEELLAAAMAQKPTIIVIDTLAMAMPGLEENDAAGMNRVVQIGRALARCGAAVLFVHHGTKADGSTPRGHGVFNGALDFSIQVKAADKGGVVRTAIRKNRNGPADLDIAFRIGTRNVGEDIDGEPLHAPVCEPCVTSAGPAEPPLKKSAKALLDLLDSMVDEAGHVSKERLRTAAIDGELVSDAKESASRRRAFDRAIKELKERKLVVVKNEQCRRSTRFDRDDLDTD